MKWLRRLLGTDFPDPQVGQVWRSRHSGRRIRVCEACVLDTGALMVSVQHENANWHSGWGIGTYYCFGLGVWRRNLRDEARELVGMEP